LEEPRPRDRRRRPVSTAPPAEALAASRPAPPARRMYPWRAVSRRRSPESRWQPGTARKGRDEEPPRRRGECHEPGAPPPHPSTT
jgi:hypothetical protein